jgi:hypothetical protein
MAAEVAIVGQRYNYSIDNRIGLTMTWLALEIFLGLAAFALIVWWTLPRTNRSERDDKD